jgi:putative flippase GtrA
MEAIERFSQRRGVRQFVKFGIVGASGFAVNMIVFTIIQHFTPPELRAGRFPLLSSIAFLTGGVTNYFFNRIWTFRSSAHPLKQGIQFITVSVIALVVGLAVAKLAAPLVGTGHRAQVLVTFAGMLVNFFINKYWTFRTED